jgi:hypothetical protein
MRSTLALLLVLIPLHAWAFNICDVEVGKPATVEQVRKAMNVKCRHGWAGMMVCKGTARLADRTADANVVISDKGLVQRIRLHPETNHYERVLAHLVARFGRPDSLKTLPSRDARGFPEKQEVRSWITPSGEELVLMKFSAVPDRSLIYVGDATDRTLLGNKLE